MICNIVCLVWIAYILLIVWLHFSFEGAYEKYVFVLALADAFISVPLLIMVFYNRWIKRHTEGCVLIQLSQPPVLYPPHDVAYNTRYREQDHLAPTAPQHNLAPTAPQDTMAPTAPPKVEYF